MADRPRRFRFSRCARLSGERAFRAVFDSQCSHGIGPLVFYVRPNETRQARLGLVVSRRVGTATRRNRIKRLLREAFRLSQHDLPGDYDVVIVVRPHKTRMLDQYRTWLETSINHLHQRWTRRLQNEASDPDSSHAN